MATVHAPGFPFVILSAERVENTPEDNAFDTGLMRAYLNRAGLTYDTCQGQYAGTKEVSFRVCLTEGNDAVIGHELDVVCKLARGFRQECVLAVRDDGYAALVYQDNTAKHIGWWAKCEEADLQGTSPDFTRIGDEYFIVKEAA